MSAADWQTRQVFTDLFTVFLRIKCLTREEVTRRGLSMSHFIALRALQAEAPCTMSKLTECLDLTHGASTGIIDRLAKDGLVDRTSSPQDRRVVNVQLTPAGGALLRELEGTVEASFEALVTQLDPATREQVAQGVRLLANVIRTSSQPHGDTVICP